MSEDRVLNSLVKASLEEAGAFELHLPRRQSTILPWAISSLLAASVAIAVALQAWVVPPKVDALVGAIAFLSEADGVEIAPGDPAEMLYDWQESPLWL